ncbi:hypothetical protein D3C87_2191850 [compost metagenome]
MLPIGSPFAGNVGGTFPRKQGGAVETGADRHGLAHLRPTDILGIDPEGFL